MEGYPVQGVERDKQGKAVPIKIKGNRIEIDRKGNVTVDNAPAGTISVIDFKKPYSLTKSGAALFVPSDPQAIPQPGKAQVQQGFTEGSNVDSISEMVQLIETNRYFEACSKVIKGFDDIAAKAVNELGKV
jgi:flagellar basal-body rod protein FlgG